MNIENNWYKTMIDKINAFAEEYELTEDQTIAVRELALIIARDQFKQGNRAGITWGLKLARERIEEGKTLNAFKYQIENK